MADTLSGSSMLELKRSEVDLEDGKLNKITYSNSENTSEIKNQPIYAGNVCYKNTYSESEDNLRFVENFYGNSGTNYPMKEISLNSSKPKSLEREDGVLEDPDTICGFGSYRPKWLQLWATPKMYLLLHSIIGVVSGSHYAYRFGVMSTLERRFSFKSKTTGAIVIFDEITPVLLGPLVGYFGGRMHRPRVIALGTLLSALCCFISALPYLIYGPANHFDGLNSAILKNGSDLQQCDGSVRLEECDADDRPPTLSVVLLWLLAGILKGFGNLTYHSIGLSYMDDFAKKKNTPMYFAISCVLRLFGPLLGFLMSSICLKYFENPLDNPGYGPDDPRWVGAWWMGFVLEGFLLLLVTVPVSMFPRSLPGVKKPVDRSGKDTRNKFAGMLDAVKRLFYNPLLWAITLYDIISIYAFVGHHNMLPKYMEHQFRLTASDASLYSGVPGIGAVMLAIIIGGYLIWKFRPTLKFLLGALAISEIIAACGFLVLMIPKCEKLEMANFGMNDEGLILEGNCNMNCNCSRKSFTPVCGSDLKTLYFSPCYAGCEQSSNKTYFTNCSCISASVNLENYATEGFCMTESCWLHALTYIIAWPIIQFIVNIFRVMQKLMLLRCTQPQDKSIVIAIFEGVTSIFGFIPYLIIFGGLVDSTCLVWESSCEETGNCWFYDTDKFSIIMHGMSAGFSFLNVGTLCLIYSMRGRFCDLYEDDFFVEENKEIENDKATKRAEG